MSNSKYPTMLYKDGMVGNDWRIAVSEEEEAAARADGYLDHTEAKADKPAGKSAKASKAAGG